MKDNFIRFSTFLVVLFNEIEADSSDLQWLKVTYWSKEIDLARLRLQEEQRSRFLSRYFHPKTQERVGDPRYSRAR